MLTGILIVYLLIVFRNNLIFSGLREELYDFMSENDEIIHLRYNGYVLLCA